MLSQQHLMQRQAVQYISVTPDTMNEFSVMLTIFNNGPEALTKDRPYLRRQSKCTVGQN